MSGSALVCVPLGVHGIDWTRHLGILRLGLGVDSEAFASSEESPTRIANPRLAGSDVPSGGSVVSAPVEHGNRPTSNRAPAQGPEFQNPSAGLPLWEKSQSDKSLADSSRRRRIRTTMPLSDMRPATAGFASLKRDAT